MIIVLKSVRKLLKLLIKIFKKARRDMIYLFKYFQLKSGIKLNKDINNYKTKIKLWKMILGFSSKKAFNLTKN